ncbi:hypothetical protein U9M48_022146 [Paspalum notatum var. saurae]|uniref:BTB domain-containing protein n=1 Tax=Paspalum notatum var. saurae TaxID=547442 RepID=A0AAQ3TH40_PASNO
MAAAGPNGSGDSTGAAVSVKAFHVLKIDGYSRTLNTLHAVAGLTLPSVLLPICLFRAGGRTWQIEYYPKGSRAWNTDSISLFLVLLADAGGDEGVTTVQATFSLLDQDQKPVLSYSRATPMTNLPASLIYRAIGDEMFLRRRDLERSKHLVDDCFAVRVDVHILVKELNQARPSPAPSEDMLQHHIGSLLYSEEGADLEFRVGDSTFRAHQLLLSARSPVFRLSVLMECTRECKNIELSLQLWNPTPAELSAPDRSTDVIDVVDMEAPAFRALLSFIDTDVLPPPLEMQQDDEYAMTQQLLVAADKYSLQRLKLICEDRLCRRLAVVTTSIQAPWQLSLLSQRGTTAFVSRRRVLSSLALQRFCLTSSKQKNSRI